MNDCHSVKVTPLLQSQWPLAWNQVIAQGTEIQHVDECLQVNRQVTWTNREKNQPRSTESYYGKTRITHLEHSVRNIFWQKSTRHRSNQHALISEVFQKKGFHWRHRFNWLSNHIPVQVSIIDRKTYQIRGMYPTTIQQSNQNHIRIITVVDHIPQ